jgi:hypothetical protein
MRLTVYSIIACVLLSATARAFDAAPLMSFFQPVAASGPLWPNLGAHYLCNDSNANATVTDTTGVYNGTAGQNTALSSVAGKINNGFYGTGGLNGFTIGNHFNISSNTAISFCFWVKLNSSPSGYQEILWKSAVPVGYWFHVYDQDDGGKPGFVIYDGIVNLKLSYDAALTANGSTWSHLAMTRSAAGVYKQYLNGSIQSRQATNVNSLVGTGVLDVSKTLKVVGAFDDIRIYNRDLAATEVAEIYNAGTGTEQE